MFVITIFSPRKNVKGDKRITMVSIVSMKISLLLRNALFESFISLIIRNCVKRITLRMFTSASIMFITVVRIRMFLILVAFLKSVSVYSNSNSY